MYSSFSVLLIKSLILFKNLLRPKYSTLETLIWIARELISFYYSKFQKHTESVVLEYYEHADTEEAAVAIEDLDIVENALVISFY